MSEEFDIDLIKTMYEDKKMSWQEIAKFFGTYTNKVRRFGMKHGVQSRDTSTAQSLAIKQGKREHPTKGKKRSEAVKVKIGNKQVKNWENISEEERERRSQISRKLWEEKTADEKTMMRENAIKGVLRASKDGSKIEKYLEEKLRADGYEIETHKEDLISAENVHIDIYIPNYAIAIEIDGPAHFLPIWGEEKLQKHIAKDQRKNAMILSYGFTIVRIKCITKTITITRMYNIYEQLKKLLEDIINDLPNKRNKLYEIEAE